MYEILSKYPIVAVAFIAIVTVIAIFLFVKIMQNVGMAKIRGEVYKLFLKAEHKFQHGENEEKFSYVVGLAKNEIPEPFSMFITEAFLRKVVQLWFDLCKDLLDDGKMNGSVAESKTEEVKKGDNA